MSIQFASPEDDRMIPDLVYLVDTLFGSHVLVREDSTRPLWIGSCPVHRPSPGETGNGVIRAS